MQIAISSASIKNWEGDILIIGLLENELKTQLEIIDKRFDSSLENLLKKQEFSAKKDDIVSFTLLNESPEKLIMVGLGNTEDISINSIRSVISKAATKTIGTNGKIGIYIPWNLVEEGSAVEAIVESIRLSLFKDIRFMSNPESHKKPSELELIGINLDVEDILKKANKTCLGVELARELVGAPPNELTPTILAKNAEIISQNKNFELKILDRSDCNNLNMGAYLAVSQGSDLEPKFIHLTYRPKNPIKKTIALIGKGLTFDSGGYNLKVGAAQIDLMKFDMGGSAAVLGTARAIAEIQPPNIEIHFIVAACENMVNGSAVHPGDIVKASNKKTIEINNTDAEGRLTLADALVYASKLKPDAIVDLATLTGACVVALGDEIAGLWTDNDELSESISKAANRAGEGIWRMPMHQPYKDGLKSILADLKNTGPRPAGSITAALFLKEFVDPSIPWAHIDIAGPVWSEKGTGDAPAGATGYGVKTLVNWVCDYQN